MSLHENLIKVTLMIWNDSIFLLLFMNWIIFILADAIIYFQEPVENLQWHKYHYVAKMDEEWILT